MARLNAATYPDRLVFERYARRVRRDELDVLFGQLARSGATALQGLFDLLHLPAIQRGRTRHV